MVQQAGEHRVRPLRRDAEQNRQRILRAASEVFTARGLQATLDDVARQAGVGVGTVYRRFPDKDALVDALFEDKLQALVTRVERALEAPDSWTGLVTMMEQAGEMLTGDRGLLEMLMYATYGKDRVSRARARMQPVVTRVVERAQRDGKLRADFRPTDVPFIEFMLSMAAEYAAPVQPEIWRRYLTLIVDGMRPCRAETTPLPGDALTPEDMETAMRTASQRRR